MIKEALEKNILDSVLAKKAFLKEEDQIKEFEKAVSTVVHCYRNGGRLYIAGNGGSAADAQHLAAEFVSKLSLDRDSLPAEALTVDSSILTAIGNDYGFDKVFSRQVSGKLTSRDVFLGITTSGNSTNIIRAIDECKKIKAPTIVFSGHDGGLVKERSDCCIIATGDRTSTIQEIHIILAHTLCECVERDLF